MHGHGGIRQRYRRTLGDQSLRRSFPRPARCPRFTPFWRVNFALRSPCDLICWLRRLIGSDQIGAGHQVLCLDAFLDANPCLPRIESESMVRSKTLQSSRGEMHHVRPAADGFGHRRDRDRDRTFGKTLGRGADQARRGVGAAGDRRAKLFPARRQPRRQGRRAGRSHHQPHRQGLCQCGADAGLAHRRATSRSRPSHSGKKPFETVSLPYGKQVLWPDHCVQGTEGAALSKDLSIPQAGLIVRKGFHKEVDSYSAFTEADGKTTTGSPPI